MNYTEFTGKTVEEAVEKGLKELGIARENADIRVLEEGKKKLFGSIKARVEIAAKETETKTEEKTVAPVVNAEGATDGERTVVFLEGLFKLLNITACTELVSEGEKVEINVTAANTTTIIGKRVVVDCENYRENREATLNKLADNLAEKAMRLGRKIKLEPMNPYERRIIHAALSEKEGVSTTSEGKEPNRYIVIVPNNLEDPDAPAMPARNERGGRGRDRDRNGRGGRGGRNFGGNRGGRGSDKKPYNRDRKPSGSGSTGGTTMKPSNDFFGIFLGNSNSDKND